MMSWKPYAWKELHQSRRLALAALGVFLAISFVPSIIDSIRSRGQWYEGNPLGAMFLAGPVLAVIAGVCAAGRDQGAVERFWRSRPVNLNLWLLSKYVTGLAIVWLVCWIPIATTMLGAAFEPRDEPLLETIGMPLAYSFILLLIYSASFMLGQLVRGTLHAAILAVGAMAMIFIVPLAVAPLNWLSLEVMQRADIGAWDFGSVVAFPVGMTVLSIGLLCLSGILLKRGIQIDADQRTLSWSVIAILLVLAASVAFPMGTNLTPQQVISLPDVAPWEVRDLKVAGDDALVLLADFFSGIRSVHVHIGEQLSVVDKPLWFVNPPLGSNISCVASDLAWSAKDPLLAYVIVTQEARQGATVAERTATLYTIDLDARQYHPVAHRIELNSLLDAPYPNISLHEDRLYVYGRHEGGRLLVFSLADPRAPSLIRSLDLEQPIGLSWPGMSGSPSGYGIQLAPLPDLDDSARLEVTWRLAPNDWTPAGDGRVLAFVSDSSGVAVRLVLFETGPEHDNIVPLYPNAQRRIAAVEGLLGSYDGGNLCTSNRLAYHLNGWGVTVYDIRDSKRIERIGHYAAGESFTSMAVLPDNRLAIAGEKLHILDLSDAVSR